MAVTTAAAVNVGDDDEKLLDLGETTEYRKEYTLSKARYVNVVQALVFVDGVISMILWLTGGDSDYFVNSVTNFHLKGSVFDLAIMAALKVIFHAPLLSYLESISLALIDVPYNTSLRCSATFVHGVTILFSLASLIYSTCKGGFILNAIMHDDSYTHMHPTYNGLVITAVVFSLIELGLMFGNIRAMRRLKDTRVLHMYDNDGREVDKDGKPVPKKVNLLRLISLAKPEMGIVLFASFCLLFSSGSQMLAPLYFGKVVDAAQTSMADLNRTILTLFIIYLIGGMFSMARSWLFTLAGQRVVARLRKNLFKSIVRQDVAFFDVNRTGELCNRLASDTQVLQNAVTVNLSMLTRNIVQMVGSLAFMFSLNAALTGVLLSVVPIVSLGAVQYGMFMKNLRKQFQDRLGDAGTHAEEALSSIRTVRSFAGEDKASKLYGNTVDQSYKVGKKLAAAGGIFEGGMAVFVQGAIVMVLWYGGKLVYENTQDSSTGITPGILTSFLLYTLQIGMCFALLSTLYGDFMQALGASLRIFDLLDRKPDVPCEDGETPRKLDGWIEFKSVEFTYPSRPESKVVKSLSFNVEPGEMVALVGPSGGGKSTLVNLIERFYDPDAGTITIGGHDLRELDPQWFRRKVSMVSQEPTLFACSIRENIAYGRDASLDEVIAVSKEANAHDFIDGFEEKYDTLVGERGVRLSGGQKQRIAIARALIMNPVILLLDEATSALDAESEHLVQEAIDRAMTGRTVVIIAHRLSTVRNASKVIVIDQGTIAEQGTHEELLSHNGVYKKLVLRQLMAGTVSEKPDTNPGESSSSGEATPAEDTTEEAKTGNLVDL